MMMRLIIIAVCGLVLIRILWAQRAHPKKFILWSSGAFSLCLWILTGYIVFLRYMRGLGSVTAMSDNFPWGLWIGFDVMCGVALSAGGFVIAGCVHLFRIRRFESVLRPAVLTAFLGYFLVIVALLLDLGRPYRIWHPIVMWQHHSIMFEVAWCVTLYTAVLALEFAPVMLEKFQMNGVLKILRLFTTPIVLAGVLLSTLHQSSLGSMFLIVPEKLYALWYSPLLPLFFIVSAIAAGLCMVIVESSLSSWFFSRSLETEVLVRLGQSASVVLFFYLILKLADLSARNVFPSALSWNMETVLFSIEIIFGVLLPAALLAQPRLRRQPRWLFFSACLAVSGVILNRLNVSWLGILRYSHFSYVPSWMEVIVTLGLVSAGVFVFSLAAKFLPIFEEEKKRAEARAPSVKNTVTGRLT